MYYSKNCSLLILVSLSCHLVAVTKCLSDSFTRMTALERKRLLSRIKSKDKKRNGVKKSQEEWVVREATTNEEVQEKEHCLLEVQERKKCLLVLLCESESERRLWECQCPFLASCHEQNDKGTLNTKAKIILGNNSFSLSFSRFIRDMSHCNEYLSPSFVFITLMFLWDCIVPLLHKSRARGQRERLHHS